LVLRNGMLRIENLHAEVDGKPILHGLTLSVGAAAPSPRWGEGLEAQKLLGISLEGSVG
jgi:Fe-S cluster assembly ATP-binding protein